MHELVQRGDVSAHDLRIEALGGALGLQVTAHFFCAKRKRRITDAFADIDEALHSVKDRSRGGRVAGGQCLGCGLKSSDGGAGEFAFDFKFLFIAGHLRRRRFVIEAAKRPGRLRRRHGPT